MSDTSIPGNHDIKLTFQGILPVNLEAARVNPRSEKGQERLAGNINPAYLGVEHLDIMGRFKDSEGNPSEFVVSSLNGKWVHPGEEAHFEGVSLSRVYCGEKHPITIQFHGVVTLVNNSKKLILPGQYLKLKTPVPKGNDRLIDGRLLFTLEPIDVKNEILSFTRRMLNNVTKSEIEFNNKLNNEMNQESIILRNMVLNSLSSSLPIMSMLCQLGIITINIDQLNVQDLIRDTNTKLNINDFDNVNRGTIVNGQLSTANPITKNQVSDKTQALAKLFGLYSQNSNLKADKLIQLLMMRSFSKDKNIDNISDSPNSSLSIVKENSETISVELLTLTSNKIKDMSVAKSLNESRPGSQFTIQF